MMYPATRQIKGRGLIGYDPMGRELFTSGPNEPQVVMQ